MKKTKQDKIAGHNSGLTALAALFGKSRTKTTTEKITLPYRNGIIHGRDLGYANKLIATKVWSCLFAVADWARKIEGGDKHKPTTETKEPSIWEVLQTCVNTQKKKDLIAKWKPRSIRIGKDVNVSGDAFDYQEGTPERTFVEFVEFWKSGNYGEMARRLKDIGRQPISKRAGEVRNDYGATQVDNFEILAITDQAAAITEIKANILFSKENGTKEKEVTIRMICETPKGEPAIRDQCDAIWKIIEAGFYDVIFGI